MLDNQKIFILGTSKRNHKTSFQLQKCSRKCKRIKKQEAAAFNSKNAVGNVKKKRKRKERHSSALGPSLNMTICLFNSEKHNFLAKFCYRFGEIRKEGMRQTDVLLCYKTSLGISIRGILYLENVH